ncbi:MAG: family 16 glycosylhydrolase [Kiritimatiellia bacterium]|jgi:beta-glucanase (GH16 family)|nr:family 16 glycosylhydrolase [Kiritimatiellia bacterium]
MKAGLMLLACVIAAAGVTFGAETPTCPLGADWEFSVEFSDEFNGVKLDDAKWWDFNPAWHGRKPAFFSRDNVAVRDGRLCLTARVQKPEEVTVENRVRGYDRFTTAIVKSKKRITYGYFEARCKSMRASVCNAFWLYDPLNPPAKYKEGSFSEEIDIFEIFGKPAKTEHDRVFFATVHRFCTPYVESIANAKQTPLPKKSARYKMPFDFWADFHVYGFLWTPREMRWFVDGKEVFARDNDYYTTALHIMLDCEIMQGWVGLPDPADLPATFEIDYLRVWRQKDLPIPKAPGF